MDDVVNEHLIPSLDFHHLKVVSALGRGATGVVFLVRDQKTNECFALKVIWRDLIEKKKARDLSRSKSSNKDENDHYRRIWFEQQALRSFEHPLLPRLKGVLSTEKIVGCAIDYCPGRDLNYLRKKQTEQMFSDDSIRFYAAEMVLVLEYLHNQGIVYRDLKPENVMIQENGHLMLVDFDLSTKLSPKTPFDSPTSVLNSALSNRRAVSKKRRSVFQKFCNSGIPPEDSDYLSQLTVNSVPKSEPNSSEKSNSFVGTEEYVAPEIVSGNGHDFSVDWWSLGIVLHEMLYGTTPFKGSNRKETFYRILCKTPELLGELTPLRDLIRRLLEKDPTKRIDVDEIKGHEFFRGMDWAAVLEISRPPHIPSLSELESENESNGTEVIKEIDVELYVQEIFSTSNEDRKNQVDEQTSRRGGGNNANKTTPINELNPHPCEDNNFLVF